ncbi:copper resistance CopC/CopD family protein [Neobacillus sp. Marseille-QA0830]
MKWILYSYLLILVFALFIFVYPLSAYAHAYIIKSNPSDNEILSEAPKKVSIEFDETIQPSYNSIEVFESSGKRVDQNNGRVSADHPSILECDLAENLPNGTYRIQWRVVSSDGHPVEGVIPFQIGNEGTNQSTIDRQTAGYVPQFDLVLIRWLQYISNACLVGVLFFCLFVSGKELIQDLWVSKALNRLIRLSVTTLCISIILGLPLQATIETGFPWSKVLNFQVLMDMVTNTSYGDTWILQISCLILLFIAAFILMKNKYEPLWIGITFLIGTGLLLSKAFISHAAASTNPGITITLDFIHLLSASIWMGSLIVLVALIPLVK